MLYQTEGSSCFGAVTCAQAFKFQKRLVGVLKNNNLFLLFIYFLSKVEILFLGSQFFRELTSHGTPTTGNPLVSLLKTWVTRTCTVLDQSIQLVWEMQRTRWEGHADRLPHVGASDGCAWRATASTNLLSLCCLPWNPAEQSVVSLSTELESGPESFNQQGGVYWAEGNRESKGPYFPQNILPSSSRTF